MKGAFPRGRPARRLPPVFFFTVSLCLFFPARGKAQDLSLDDTLSGLALSAPAAVSGAAFRWDPFLETGIFTFSGHTAAFETGRAGDSGFLVVDGRDLFSLPVPYLENGVLFFPHAFTAALKNTFARSLEDDASRFRIAAVIIDPGHGGKDSGAVGHFTVNGAPFKSVEKDITLAVSKKLHAFLSAALPDKRILLTRNGDTYPSLEDRVALANSVPLKNNEAVIFVSVHANASLNSAARGFEVWYLNPGYRRDVIDKSRYADSEDVIPILNDMMEEEFTTESILIARSILNRLGETGRMPSRGIKAEEWFVVRNARMPSVLVEVGFVTNREDALLMADDGYLQKTAEAIYKGIMDFTAAFERSGGYTAVQ
ncbi:MAG: N-acetylmuramoyl-L-alanine amidase [Treponema sp.]|jgi:N-acetylmuramoyl-L-alanine amidase|nr:N-acetylmuramoyl-L-alanine amidase [Treponema sp.]